MSVMTVKTRLKRALAITPGIWGLATLLLHLAYGERLRLGWEGSALYAGVLTLTMFAINIPKMLEAARHEQVLEQLKTDFQDSKD